MHLQDGPQLDLSAQVAKVREKARPWRSIIALTLAIAAAATSGWMRHDFHSYFARTQQLSQIIAAGCAVAFCAFGIIGTYSLSGNARAVLEPRTGPSHAAVVRYAILLLGVFTTLVITLLLFSVPVGQLVLGGALTSVFVGIAAQQALSNVFAGIVLLLARPFRVGDAIKLRAGALGGELDGTVTDIGITYVRLDTGTSIMSVPNSQVLNAVVGPLPQSPAGDSIPQSSAGGPISQSPAGGPISQSPAGDPISQSPAGDPSPPPGNDMARRLS
jgi:small-conductance mechanosensitive channel